jgi:lysophospholipase L1-like esterase
MQLWITRLADRRHVLKYASISQLEKIHGQSGKRWSTDRYLGHRPTANYAKGKNRHNALGFRGKEIITPKPADTFRIVCLGGSTTYTTAVEDANLSYPAILETQLKERGYKNIEVVNAGVGAYTSFESLVNFQFRVLDIEPDMVIVYHAVNDILTRIVWPQTAYRGDNSAAVCAASLKMPSILEYSSLARYIMIRAGIVKPHSSIDRWMAPHPASYLADDFEIQIKKNVYPSGIFKETPASEMLAKNKPVYFERNLENLASLAQKNNVKVVFATFAYSPDFPDEATVSSTEFINAYAEMNDVTKKTAAKTNSSLFDFGEVFPNDKNLFTDGRHLNEDGAKLKAKLFADYLINHNLIPDKP